MSGGGSVKAGREVAAGLREAKLRASIVSIFDQIKVVSDISSRVVGPDRIETLVSGFPSHFLSLSHTLTLLFLSLSQRHTHTHTHSLCRCLSYTVL